MKDKKVDELKKQTCLFGKRTNDASNRLDIVIMNRQLFNNAITLTASSLAYSSSINNNVV
ncbi:hypothetical protein BLOT_000467 [Blomia tropicalis]|nr:hypothetical protein BLOT_000467 [Blomia tropicalis]